MVKRKNGAGTVKKISDNVYEAIVQSTKYMNPQTGNFKRFKRRGVSEESALANAKRACYNWEMEMSLGRDEKVDKSKTFGQYMMDYLENVVAKSKITDSTYHSYYRNMQNMFYEYDISNYQLHMLDIKVFADYYNLLLSQYAKKSTSTPRQMCIRCCKWLVDKKLLEYNMAELAQYEIEEEIIDEYNSEMMERERNRKKIWSNEDIQKFYDSYRNGTGGEIINIILFMIETGVRPGEFQEIKLDDIDFEKKTIFIDKANGLRFKDRLNPEMGVEYYTKVTKNKDPRTIYLSDFAIEITKVMIEQTKIKCKDNKNGLLYPQFRTGKKRTNSSMEICCSDLCDKLGIDRDVHRGKRGYPIGLSLHSCRHTYDSIANNATGANMIATALSMGHRNITTQNIYTHQTEQGMRSIRRASEEVLGLKVENTIPNALQGQIEANKSIVDGLSEEEEKMLLMLLQKKYGK